MECLSPFFLFPTNSYVGDFLCSSMSGTVKYIIISGKSNKSKNAGSFCFCSYCVVEGLCPPMVSHLAPMQHQEATRAGKKKPSKELPSIIPHSPSLSILSVNSPGLRKKKKKLPKARENTLCSRKRRASQNFPLRLLRK